MTLFPQEMGLVTWDLALFEDRLVRTLQLLQLTVLSLSYVFYNQVTKKFEHFCRVCDCHSHFAEYSHIVGCYAFLQTF